MSITRVIGRRSGRKAVYGKAHGKETFISGRIDGAGCTGRRHLFPVHIAAWSNLMICQIRPTKLCK